MLLALVALLGIVLLSGCGGVDARRQSHMERGQKYLAEGRPDKARVEFLNALQIAPNDSDARFMVGQVAEKLGDVRQAYAMYQGAVDANPENVKARANLARVLAFAGDADRAMQALGPGLKKHPDDADLITVRGAARVLLKDTVGAMSDAERAVKLAPTNENAVALLASLYQRQGDRVRAVRLLTATLERLPQSADLRQVLAGLYAEGGDAPRAEEQLRMLVDMHPKDLRLRYQLAGFYARGQRLEDAERTLKQTVASAPDNDEAKLAYVDFLTTRRSKEQGESALKDYIAKSPRKTFDLRLALASLQQGFGRADEAIATYRAIVADDPSGPKGITARTRIAALDVVAGRLEDARRLVAEVLKQVPRDNDALVLRGNIALEAGDTATAIADFRAVLQDQPNNVPVMRTLARSHLANGEPALAEENLRAAMSAAPDDVTVQLELATLLMQTQRADKAVELLEKTVHEHPADVPAHENLLRAYVARHDLPAARTAAEDLKTLRPDGASGPYFAGVIAQAQGRNADAVKEYERALQLQPTAMDALTALVRMESAKGQREAAVARVRAVIAADTHNAIAHNLLGELLLSARNSPEAVAEFDQAITLAPKWWIPHRNMALARLAAKDIAGGIAAYEAGVKATQFDLNLVTELASLYEQQQHIDAAIGLYESLQQRQPRLELAANNLAMLLVTHRQDQASLDRARDLTASFSQTDNGALLDTYGWVKLKRGEIDAALPALERAAVQSPDSRVIRYHLGMVQFKAGQRDKARSSLEAALAGAQSFTGRNEARTVLAQLKGRAG